MVSAVESPVASLTTKAYHTLAMGDPEDLIFGKSVHPLNTRRGLVIGGGKVHPEINFTVPPMEVNHSTFGRVKELYAETVEDIAKRAVELECEGFVVEFETLIEMTTNPSFAIELTSVMNDVLEKYYQQRGLKTAIRITPNDPREMVRPPMMRSGQYVDCMLKTFEGCARAGAEFLSIESTGGKEIHDDALVNCDISAVLFALSVMGCRDMAWLWHSIKDVADKTGTVAAGDTACGFGNTAMVLADRKFIPRVFAAAVRSMTAVRSLVAYEQGAIGPGKDCGYENVFIKAITGYPMSMEGKAAACAHLSPVGNVASATCDLWSNESVQMFKLLGGMAPTVSIEQLIYDCRMMNLSHVKGQALMLRDLMVDSDTVLDPQALILSPANAVRIAGAIVQADNHYRQTVAAATETLAIIREAYESGTLKLSEMEVPWIDMIGDTLAGLPANEDDFIARVQSTLDQSKFRAEDYGL
jgi:methanol---5-hydroxybenzimidazolylcobamide Co-methyltransferase